MNKPLRGYIDQLYLLRMELADQVEMQFDVVFYCDLTDNMRPYGGNIIIDELLNSELDD